jgi:hypothetical protein
MVVNVKRNIFVSKNKEAGIKQMIGAMYFMLLKAISTCVWGGLIMKFLKMIIKLLAWNTHGREGEERTVRVAHGVTTWHSAPSV